MSGCTTGEEIRGFLKCSCLYRLEKRGEKKGCHCCVAYIPLAPGKKGRLYLLLEPKDCKNAHVKYSPDNPNPCLRTTDLRVCKVVGTKFCRSETNNMYLCIFDDA